MKSLDTFLGGTVAVWRVRIGDETRWAVGTPDGVLSGLLRPQVTLASILQDPAGISELGLSGASLSPVPSHAEFMPPIEDQEVWASGVTYRRSREARINESESPDHYDLVYDAQRPELFFKAMGRRVRGTGERIAIRSDSTWNVPEPELALLLQSDGSIAGVTLCNDVSSRSIEGENPLYLPQAKVYEGSCALGPCIVSPSELGLLTDIGMTCAVVRRGVTVFRQETSTSAMHRRFEDLATCLTDYLNFEDGVFLSTGTGIVPPPSFTLEEGDVVIVQSPLLGRLENVVDILQARTRSSVRPLTT